jgi:aldehyde:ferredoxin oxidoreductase
MAAVAGEIQRLRWRMRVGTGFRPENVSIPKRFSEVTTRRGPVDRQSIEALKAAYGRSILELAGSTGEGRRWGK